MLNQFEAIILEWEGQNYKNKVASKIMKLCEKMVASFWKLQKFQKKVQDFIAIKPSSMKNEGNHSTYNVIMIQNPSKGVERTLLMTEFCL